MKNKTIQTHVLHNLSEDDIRAYAYHLYEQSNGEHGHDLEHWYEAVAHLQATIPSSPAPGHQDRYLNAPVPGTTQSQRTRVVARR